MCADCKGALAQRCEAADKLLSVMKEPFSFPRSLRLAFPLQPVPADMNVIALRIGGGR